MHENIVFIIIFIPFFLMYGNFRISLFQRKIFVQIFRQKTRRKILHDNENIHKENIRDHIQLEFQRNIAME